MVKFSPTLLNFVMQKMKKDLILGMDYYFIFFFAKTKTVGSSKYFFDVCFWSEDQLQQNSQYSVWDT